jgi:uncharacterized membrane protein
MRRRWRKLEGWGIPLSWAFAALCVGMVLPRFERRVLPDLVSTMSASAAMSVCSSIASGMITLTGIVFSLTFVMVQFSATAYSPRLVLWVASDRVMAHALGVFTATFLYALMLLGWVDRDLSGKVPLVSGWLVLGLLLASIGMFIALIERIALLQVNRMLIFTGDQGRKAIADMYGGPASVEPERALPEAGQPLQILTHVGRPRVIQTIAEPTLVLLAAESDARVELGAAVGDTVLEGTPLLRVYGTRRIADESALREAIGLGDERTFEQDPKYALRLMVDIAIKALSPAINDPTTAVQVLDQIEDLLLRLGRSRLEIGVLRDVRGVPRVVVTVPNWEDFLRLALDEIRCYGAGSVQVMRRMKALIHNLRAVLPSERHVALRDWDERLQATIARAFEDEKEQQDASVPDRQGLGCGEKANDRSGARR